MSAHEAEVVLAHFTNAKDGDMVMDGSGVVWTFQSGWWIGFIGRRRMQVMPVVIAKALNPDIADLIESIA